MKENPSYNKLIEEVRREFGRSIAGTSDYDELSLSIQEKTGRTLSTSTIKRLFGYVRYDSAPRMNTLNILAAYTGCKDWEEFENNLRPEEKAPALPDESGPKIKPAIYKTVAAAIATLGIIAAIAFWPGGTEKKEATETESTTTTGAEEVLTPIEEFRKECISLTMEGCKRIRSHREKMEDAEYRSFAYQEYLKLTFTQMKSHINEGVQGIFPDDETQRMTHQSSIFTECQNIAIEVLRELNQPPAME